MKKSLLLITAICSISFGMKAQIQNYSVGQTVNDFTVTDIHGNSHTLSSITASGKWVLIDFFFTACPPCQGTVPFFSQLHEKYGCNSADLYCISIDTGDSDADVTAFENTFSTSSGFSPAPAVSGTEGGGNAVDNDFNPLQYPTYCLVDPTMTLRNADIWPVSSIADFESAFAAANFSPAPTACAAGLENIASINTMSVYPNPATLTATINVSLESSNDVTAYVYNMVGAVVSTQSYNGVNGENKFVLATEGLENGQYILKVALGNGATKQISINVLR